LIPTDECCCEYGGEIERVFFLSGHDKVAETAILLIEYEEILEILARQGYLPGVKIIAK
jgi:hypothetical protein